MSQDILKKRIEKFPVVISQIDPMDLRFPHMVLTEYELLVQTIYKLNELIDVTNKYYNLVTDFIEWVTEEGLKEAVLEQLNIWLIDGTLADLINETLFNTKLDKTVFFEYKLVQEGINLTVEEFLNELQEKKVDLVIFNEHKDAQNAINNSQGITNTTTTQRIKDLEKRIEDFAYDITPYYNATLDLSVAVKNCMTENYKGDTVDEGLHIFFPNREYITHNSIDVDKSCMMLTGGTRTRIVYKHKAGVSNGGNDRAIFNVTNSVARNLRRIIIRNFELVKSGTTPYKVIGLQLNKDYDGSKAVVDSEFDNLWIYHLDVGIHTGASWCNNFNNIRVWSVTKALYIVQQSNNFNFTRCSFVSVLEWSDIINAEGISFVGCEFANVDVNAGWCIVMNQSSIILINPYIENIYPGKFVLLQNGAFKSMFTIMGGNQTDSNLDYIFDGSNASPHHVEISGMAGNPIIKGLWSSSQSTDLRLNNKSFSIPA